MNAIIISIGTEITEGQISNRNATWLSEKCFEAGLKVVRHEAVADDRRHILDAFLRAERDALVCFITGGLGPTSDDFTREVVLEWMKEKSVYRERSWQKIVDRLSSRGVEVAESNRQQCYFPETAVVMENLEGTADGFKVSKKLPAGALFDAYFLPGPPREVAHLWDSFIERDLQAKLGNREPLVLYRWKCIGKSEAALGEIVEAALKPYTFARGYRASPPYVEVKLWMNQSEMESPEALNARKDLDIALLNFSVARDAEDLGELFLSALSERRETYPSTVILDVGTEGTLTARLLPLLRKKEFTELRAKLEILTRFPATPADVQRPEDLPEVSEEPLFILFPKGVAVCLTKSGKEVFEIDTPYTSPEMKERLHSYYAEKALAFFRGAYKRSN